MLYVLLIMACFGPIIPGVILVRKEGFSPNWYWLSLIPFVGFMIMLIMYVNAPIKDTSKTPEEINAEKKKRQKVALVAIIMIVLLFGIPLWLGNRNSIEDYEPYVHTMELWVKEKEVRSCLGDEIKRTFGYSCKTTNNGNGSETEELYFTVRGSKTKGNVFINAYKEGEKWFYKSIELNSESFESINLLA